jgi:hypothetical protein
VARPRLAPGRRAPRPGRVRLGRVRPQLGAATESELLAHLTAIEVTGAAALVRPRSGERLRVGRALDLGAAGIVVPRLDAAEQAREAVTFVRYPPDGQRGVALLARGARLGAVGHGEVAYGPDGEAYPNSSDVQARS